MAAVNTRQTRVPAHSTLRTIAREQLGDALRWHEIADINKLKPPYVIESINPANRKPHTVVWGDVINIPIGSPVAVAQTPEEVYGTDVALSKKRITLTSGDYVLSSGRENLLQAVRHRLDTCLTELITHPEYGANISVALGMKMMPVVVMMVSGYIKRALRQEPRIASIDAIKNKVDGDVLYFDISFTPVFSNSPVDLNLVYTLQR